MVGAFLPGSRKLPDYGPDEVLSEPRARGFSRAAVLFFDEERCRIIKNELRFEELSRRRRYREEKTPSKGRCPAIGSSGSIEQSRLSRYRRADRLLLADPFCKEISYA